jgi:hypothetical protein
MKRKILLFTFCIQILQVAKSQTPWYTSGNTTTGPEFIGSSSGSFDLNFRINNSALFQMLTTGDFNIITNTQGYLINNKCVLRNYGNDYNIYVSVGAGNTNTISDNTFVGYHAGNAATTNGNDNTFVGFEAGIANTSGSINSFFGESFLQVIFQAEFITIA